jgi:hypothetical protein
MERWVDEIKEAVIECNIASSQVTTIFILKRSYDYQTWTLQLQDR